MSYDSPGRPPDYERAKKKRLEKGLSQYEAAQLLGKSQAFISLLEQGRGNKEDERNYLNALHKANDAKHRRTPGGTLKTGRLRSVREPVSRNRRALSAEPLIADFDYAATLPPGKDWAIQAICRSAPDTELGFLYSEEQDLFGLVGFHLIDGDLKRGRIIQITAEYDIAVSLVLTAFANGDIANWGDDAPSEDDDGILADDEPQDRA